MRRSIVAAMTENRVIGRDNALPWHLRDDLRRFKAITMGHTVVMGRKTWDSVGKPLPGRTTVVLSRDAGFRPAGVSVVQTMNEALELAGHDDEIFIVGGGEVFRQIIAVADRIYLTIIHAQLEGDAFFPTFDENEWRIIEDEEHPADQWNDHPFRFVTYDRK
jgi:dihydrofolate reductase